MRPLEIWHLTLSQKGLEMRVATQQAVADPMWSKGQVRMSPKPFLQLRSVSPSDWQVLFTIETLIFFSPVSRSSRGLQYCLIKGEHSMQVIHYKNGISKILLPYSFEITSLQVCEDTPLLYSACGDFICHLFIRSSMCYAF